VDKQAEPVAELADEAGNATPKLATDVPEPEATVRKPAAKLKAEENGKADENGKDAAPVTPPGAAKSSKVSATSETRPHSRPVSPASQGDDAGKPDAGGSTAVVQAHADGGAKADIGSTKPDVVPSAVSTVKAGSVPAKPVAGQVLSGSPKPAEAAKSANGAAAAPVNVSKSEQAGDSGKATETSEPKATTAAAAAMESELKRAGFASSSSTWAGTMTNATPAATPASPSGAAPTSSTDRPGDLAKSAQPEPSPWSSPASSAAAAAAGPSGSTSYAAPAWTPSPSLSSPGSQSGTSASAPADADAPPWSSSAARSPASAPPASAKPSYSSASSSNTGELTDFAPTVMAPQIPDQDSIANPGAVRTSSVLSDDLKARVTAPFAAVARMRLKPAAPGRPGNASSNGDPMSVKSKSTTYRRPAGQPAPQAARPDAPARDAQLVISRLEPWSVMKFTAIVSVVGFVVLLVAVAIFYYFFSSLGVFHSIEHTLHLVTTSKGHTASSASRWFSAGRILGYTAIAGVIEAVLITALATFGAVIYNLIARMTGGIEVTLQEAD
jgi:Transmembrane domain of unknown function (DUF3566)